MRAYRIDSIVSIRLSYQPMSSEASEARQRPNLAAVAALAGVSASTASLAFSGAGPISPATKARVLAAAEKLNYAGPDPRAQSLRRGRSGIVGVVLEDSLADAFRDPMNIAMLDGIADETGTAGASLLLLTEVGPDRASIASAPMDGVILIGCSTSLDESVAIVRQRGLPIVAIEAQPMDAVLPIALDNRFATSTAARHLKALGHERVAVVALPLERPHLAPSPSGCVFPRMSAWSASTGFAWIWVGMIWQRWFNQLSRRVVPPAARSWTCSRGAKEWQPALRACSTRATPPRRRRVRRLLAGTRPLGRAL
jgi:hypothetical protein